MICPKCKGNTRVEQSQKVNEIVARKRVCVECGYKFFTEETEIETSVALEYFYKPYSTYARKVKDGKRRSS